MWMNKKWFVTFTDRLIDERNELSRQLFMLKGENTQLQAELIRHVADKDWFKHRLNQVEMERAALIYAATGGSGGGRYPVEQREGVKVVAPQFMAGPPISPMSETLNEQYNPFGTVGEDSNEASDQIPGHEDLTHLPGYRG